MRSMIERACGAASFGLVWPLDQKLVCVCAPAGGSSVASRWINYAPVDLFQPIKEAGRAQFVRFMTIMALMAVMMTR
jgi:hypothetical protein